MRIDLNKNALRLGLHAELNVNVCESNTSFAPTGTARGILVHLMSPDLMGPK